MSAGALDQMAEHLQFLGYEIAREGELIFARHPRKFNILTFRQEIGQGLGRWP
jgi:hypothetical protein